MRRILVSVMLCLLGLCLLFGCRAWEPETVVVNKPPKIYITGAPAETSGAFYHFRVFWYGADEDGYVERYVWALTDTSVQDRRTDEDNEDSRFNPALDISHLRIGNWTTRTDTVFDFRIDQGYRTQHDMTLHVVAVDDQGAFSTRPARLHFFSNALGNPRLRFYRDFIDPANAMADFDTVAFGRSFAIRWSGSTPNLTPFYCRERLAEIDTVPRDLPPGEEPDGLLGFKWRLPQIIDCNPSVEDCWQPRRFREATGESISYFANITGMNFLNDGSGSAFNQRLLPAGVMQLLVNTIDIAGVEILPANRVLNIVVNYAPRVCIVGASVPEHLPPGNDCQQSPFEAQQYPYYIVFHGEHSRPNPDALPHPDSNPYYRYPFEEGDRIPDRAYVVFKALGWEEMDYSVDPPAPRDSLFERNAMQFQGQFSADGYRPGASRPITFSPTRSRLHQTEPWTAEHATDISADTLGFQVGPFDYRFTMLSVDENLTRSRASENFSFSANFPPCVQCIEVANISALPTTPGLQDVAWNDDCHVEECFESFDSLHIRAPGQTDPSDPFQLIRQADPITIYINPSQNRVQFRTPTIGNWFEIPGYGYYYQVFLHGREENPMEHWPPGLAHRRIAAWQYQIDYDGDPTNIIQDGGGSDNIDFVSGFPVSDLPHPAQPPAGITILNPFESIPGQDSFRGAWALRVVVGVPQTLMDQGPQAYWDQLLSLTGAPPRPEDSGQLPAWQTNSEVVLARTLYRLSTMQFTAGMISAKAVDQGGQVNRRLEGCYNYYLETRMPPLQNPRTCVGLQSYPGFTKQDHMVLSMFPATSDLAVKGFEILLYCQGEDEPFMGGQPPPGWISNKGARGHWH